MKQNVFGIISLVLGIIGMLLSSVAVGIVPCIIGLILAIIALTQKNTKHGTAIAGLVCSIIGIGIFLLMLAGFSLYNNGVKNAGEVAKVSEAEVKPVDEAEKDQQEEQQAEEPDQQENGEVDNVFGVGDIVETDDLKITFLSAEEYKDKFIMPEEGNMYYAFEFEIENISDSDQYIVDYFFNGYADGYPIEKTYFEEGIHDMLSSGKKTHGYIYLVIPIEAKEIKIEYKTNYRTENKIIIFKIEK